MPEDLHRLRVRATLRRRTGRRDAVRRLHPDTLALDLRGPLQGHRVRVPGPPHLGVLLACNVLAPSSRRVTISAGHSDQVRVVVVRGSGPRHVQEQQEAPLLVGVELADVDGRGAAVRVDVASVAAGLDRANAHARVHARDVKAQLLHGDREEPADALRERVLDGRFVLDEGESPARGLGDGVHRRRIVVRPEPEGVDRRGRPAASAGEGEGRRHERVVVGVAAAVAPAPRHGVGVLPIREEHDAGDGVPVHSLVDHLGGPAERLADVGAAARGERLHGAPRQGFAGVGHAREPHQPVRAGGEGHDAESVPGPEVVDDEPHGLLEQL